MTIVALSSSPVAPAAAGAADVSRAILRLSGPAALHCANSIFLCGENSDGPPAGTLSEVSGWRRISGRVRWKEFSLKACAYVMRAPRSYTREDVVELHVPGLPWLVSALLKQMLDAGARLAEPGEFTRRALENGRIGIEQAEAVGALIRSRSADEARIHAARLQTRSAGTRSQLKEEIEELLALVELGLDFSTEDVTVLSLDEMRRRVASLKSDAEKFVNDTRTIQGETALLNANLAQIVLAGPTNAGKSTLFNRLLGRDAAIVSAQAHTTRDRVEATLELNGVNALLIDSAGSAGDPAPGDAGILRKAAWQATEAALRCADILLLAFDATADESEGAEALAAAIQASRPAASAIVWTKQDIAAKADFSAREELAEKFSRLSAPLKQFEVSSHTGHGIENLRQFLSDSVGAVSASRTESYAAALTAARTAAARAASALARAAEALDHAHGEDVVAVELREALHAFWQADGILVRHDAVTESMLDRIFSRFCIGK